MKKTNYTINFGTKKFRVNEWLYSYFNKVKGRKTPPSAYNILYKILTGVK